jgi:hypothetical protein
MAKDNTEPDLVLGDKLATRANAAAHGADAAILDTLARVKFMSGLRAEAISLQEKAVKLGEQSLPVLRKTLESYRQGKLPPVD